MPARTTKALDEDVQKALTWLEKKGTRHDRDNLKRFGITTSQAYGVSMAHIKTLAKELGRDHDLAAALWDTGWYEARLLTAFVDDPALVTKAQMDRWTRDFDNWAVCDTLCFHLFDRSPHAWAKVAQWSTKRQEFVRRAAFALLASLALHDKRAADDAFTVFLPAAEDAASDDRDLVRKSVSWALRAIAKRNSELSAAVADVARRLAESADSGARWVGKDVLKGLKGKRKK